MNKEFLSYFNLSGLPFTKEIPSERLVSLPTVQKALGIPRECYTCIFAAARTAGWIAHVMEQFRDNRLIRPSSNYVGGFRRNFVPLAAR